MKSQNIAMTIEGTNYYRNFINLLADLSFLATLGEAALGSTVISSRL